MNDLDGKVAEPSTRPWVAGARSPLTVAAVALAYLAAAKFGLSLAFATKQVTAVWPPTGIALTALLLFGYRVWPGVFLGALIANATHGEPPLTAAGIAAGNTLGPIAGALLLRRVVKFDDAFTRLRDVFGLLVFGAMSAMLVTATNGVANLALGGIIHWAAYGAVWRLWWIGDAMGVLLVVPLLLTWAADPRLRWKGWRAVEVATLFITLAAASYFIFSGSGQYQVQYAVFPFIIWAALRFGMREVATAVALISSMAVWGAIRDRGPFATGTLDERLVLMESFMAIAAVTAFAMGAATAERSRAERWFSTTLRSIADAVVTVDLAGNVTFMNPEAETLTGVKASEALGRPAREVVQLLDGQAQALAETPLDRAMRERRRVYLPDAGLRVASTGAVRSISDGAAPVIDEGRMLGAVMVLRDVTGQKAAQKQLELADRLGSLGTMAAGVAHEVNSPLAVVITNSAFVSEELEQHRAALAGAGFRLAPEAEQRFGEIGQALGDLRSAASRIGRIVSDLRGFSRPAQGTSGRASVVDAVDWAVRTTAHEFRHRARLATRLDPTPVVEGDEARLGQVFVNLLLNAAQAIAPGSADRNEVTVATGLDERGYVQVEVRDTGPGIPAHVRDHLFEPFFTTKEVGSGTGLGLSICHGIVTALGGEIRVESEVGKGTTFRVLLPPGREQAAEVPAAPPAARPALKGRVLVVDDEEMILRAIARILRGHDLACVESARDALALLERGEGFDLILCDVMMPTMTGIDLYEELLRRSPEIARRVIFLTGGAISSKIEEFLQSAPNLRIEKPFEAGKLLDTVQRFLADQAAAGGPPATTA